VEISSQAQDEDILGDFDGAQALERGIRGPVDVGDAQVPISQAAAQTQGKVPDPGAGQPPDPRDVGAVHVGDPDLPALGRPRGEASRVPQEGSRSRQNTFRPEIGSDWPVEEELAPGPGRSGQGSHKEDQEGAEKSQEHPVSGFLEQENTRR
jgi:hypothetical protein